MAPPPADVIYNRAPKVTPEFWLAKMMTVTVGQSAFSLIAHDLGAGLTLTSAIVTIFLIFALIVQFRQKRYVPWIYWATVVLVSVTGTLVAGLVVKHLGYSLSFAITLFGLSLLVVISGWYITEKTLSIHQIVTTRREAYYWVAIFLTFALGASAGDQLIRDYGLGYLAAGTACGLLIGVIAAGFRIGFIGGVPAFWLAYILTRPTGAFFEKWLSFPSKDGGLGLGAEPTSLGFFMVMAGLVIYMTSTHRGLEKAA